MRRSLLLAVLAAALLLPADGLASTLIDRDATGVTLKVDDTGRALISYRARGKRWNVLAWGAVNALAPTTARTQVDFRLDYSGGWGSSRRDVWKTFRDTCEIGRAHV